MMPEDPIVSRVVEKLKNDSCVDLDRKHTLKSEVLAVQHRRRSKIFKLKLIFGTEEKDICVKMVTPSSPTTRELFEERVKKEYRTLIMAYENFRPFPEYSVVKPIACFPELLVVISEYFCGETLQSVLRKKARLFPSSTNMELLEKYCYSCGEWLKLFHGFTQKEPKEKLRVDEVIEYIDMRLMRLVSNSQIHFDEKLQRQVIDCVRKNLEAVKARDLLMTGQHSDFFPGNILVNAGKVVVSDFTMFSYGSIYQDFTYFYQHLDAMLTNPLYRRETVSRLQRSFLSGYGRDIDRWGPMFRIFQILQKVNSLCSSVAMRPTHLHMKVSRWVELRTDMACLLDLIKQAN